MGCFLSKKEYGFFFFLGVSCAAAVWIGFFALKPLVALTAFKHIGYYWIAGSFFAFCILMLKQLKQRGSGFFNSWKRSELGWMGFLVVACSAYCIFSVPSGYRIVTDEPILMATSRSMAQQAVVQTPQQALMVEGKLRVLQASVDKRPILYPFLVSLLHVVLGADNANGSLMNNLLCVVFFFLLYVFLKGCLPAVLTASALLLVTALPLMPEVTNGRGMELTMLVMLLATALCAQSYLRAPTRLSQGLFCLCVLLLAQTRYEMALFVPIWGGVLLLGWVQLKKPLLSWVLLLLPVIFIPQAWQQKVVTADADPFEVKKAQALGFWEAPTRGFSSQYVWGNLKNSLKFFFSTYKMEGQRYPSSAPLSAMGLLGVAYVLLSFLRDPEPFLKKPPQRKVLALLGWGVLLSFGLHLSYVWGRMDLSTTYRFSLLFSIASLVAFAHALNKERSRLPQWAGVSVLLAVCSLTHTSYYTQLRGYHTDNFFPKIAQFELSCIHEIKRNQPHALYITNMPYMAIGEGVQALSSGYAFVFPETLMRFKKRYPDVPIYAFQVSTQKNSGWFYENDLSWVGYVLNPLKTIESGYPYDMRAECAQVQSILGI